MIRPMTPNDAPIVAALIRTAFAAIPTPLDPAPSALQVTPNEVQTALADGGGAVWDQNGINGCVLWRPRNGTLHLGRLAVHPAQQNRGIAQSLLAAAEAEARAKNWPTITLEVRLALHSNRRLFAKAGFTETTQHAHPGHKTPTFVAAEKHLT